MFYIYSGFIKYHICGTGRLICEIKCKLLLGEVLKKMMHIGGKKNQKLIIAAVFVI